MQHYNAAFTDTVECVQLLPSVAEKNGSTELDLLEIATTPLDDDKQRTKNESGLSYCKMCTLASLFSALKS